jgi:hypothetical protein
MPDIYAVLIRFDPKDSWVCVATDHEPTNLRTRALNAKAMNPSIEVQMLIYKVDRGLPL